MWTWFWYRHMANTSPIFDDLHIRHADVAYESRDLSHQAVFYFLLVLGVGICLIYLVMWGVLRELGGSQYAGHATTNPIMTSAEQLKEIGGDPANSFPAPQLQPDPTADLNKFRIGEEQGLNTYGWVDQAHGRIHIPIEKAIEMMASSWPADQQQSSSGGQASEKSEGSGGTQHVQAATDERGGNYGW